MNTKGWHVPFRTHLELRSFKTRVRQKWFGDTRVGTFPEIVREVAREAGISEEDAAKDVERTLKRNAVKSILKPRHVEIAESLLANGFGAGEIAHILSNVEGFAITNDVINCNAEIVAWRQTIGYENPRTRAQWGKNAEVVGSEIQLWITNDAGERKRYGRLPIQAGGIEGIHTDKYALDASQRERLAGALYTAGIGQKQIASVLTDVTDTSYPGYTIGYMLQKLKRDGDNPLEGHEPGTLMRSENRQLRTRVDGDVINIYTETGDGDQKKAEKTIATVDIPSAGITWHHNQSSNKMPDRAVLDRVIASLYVSGVSPKRIQEVLTAAFATNLTSKQVIKAIEREKEQGNLQRQPKGYFHKADAREIKVQVKGDYINVWDEGKQKAKISIAEGNIVGQMDEKKQELMANGANEQENRAIDKGFETYVRFRWHNDPRVGIAEDLGQELGISAKDVRRIVSKPNAWGILKPTHVYIIQRLAKYGLTPSETARTLEGIEGISFSQTPIRTKLQRLEKAELLSDHPRDLNLTTEVTAEEIRVRDGSTGKVLHIIKLADAMAAAQMGFDGFYVHPPPSMKQYKAICKRAQETQDSFERIRQDVGLQWDTLEALLLNGTFVRDHTAYETRFLTTLDAVTINQLVAYAKNTDLSLADISLQCNCNSGTAGKYILKEAYNGDIKCYNRRFNPPPLTPEQELLANQLAQENKGKNAAQRLSLTAIVAEVGGSFAGVRAAIVNGTYSNDEAAFTSDYPAGRHDLPPQLVQSIAEAVRTTNDSAYVIGQRFDASDAAVSLVALVVVYGGDYERYAARFPEKEVDEAAMAAATEHIRDPKSPHRTCKAIAHAVSAEVAPISPASVQILARHLLTKADRNERFAGDPDYRIGQVTHVVVEGTCKRAAEHCGIAAYSETCLRRHHRQQDGPAPTSQQRRWVKADLILRLEDGRAGAEGTALGAEAGWPPEIIASTREIVFEFGADQTPASVQRKDAKYAADRHGHPKKGRLVLHVATADWWGEGRVQADPQGLANARVTSTGFVADLLQMPQHDREVLAEMARNNRARDQAAQERLAEKEGLQYCDDTALYYADKGSPIPDWHGPQQTLDAPIEAAQQVAARDAGPEGSGGKDERPAGKGLAPERLAEAREFAKVLQAARDTDAATEKKGIDPARLAEAREFAKALREARDADSGKADQGPDPNNFY